MSRGVCSRISSVLLLSMLACGGEGESEGGNSAGAGGSGGATEPFADLDELVEAGLDEYFGAADPISNEDITGDTIYDFDVADGPVCLRGAPFNVGVRQGSSENLMIFLQGGGACFPFLCAATEVAGRGVPRLGILDPEDPDNPVADWSVVYVPYCDGSVFSGDSVIEEGVDMAGARTHHGRRNISAALDLCEELFPNPKRVVFAGSSAGGYGTVFNQPLVRLKYPKADLFVINDAGIGINTRLPFLVDSWQSGPYAAPSCADCVDNPHATPIADWNFAHDSNVVVGLFTSWEDSIIRNFSSPDPVVFRQTVADETGKLSAAWGDRYKRFIIEGVQHTALQLGVGGIPDSFSGTQVRGTSLEQWVTLMIDRDPGWVDLIE